MLSLGIRPDLTLEDKEVKRQLGKCRPWLHSNLIRSDIPGSSGVSPSCSLYLRSPPPPATEISLEGPPVVKPTREELQARVDFLVKKRRSVKRKAPDPPESSLLARGKAPKLGASVLPLSIKERGSHAQVRVRGQALPSLAEVFEVAGTQRCSSSAVGAKGSLRRATEPSLKVLHIWSPSAQKATPSPPIQGVWETIALEPRGVRTHCLPMRSSRAGAVSSIL